MNITETLIKLRDDIKTWAKNNINEAKAYTDQEVANLVGSAPETLDTIEELSAALKDNADIIDVIDQAITNKADKSAVEALTYSDVGAAPAGRGLGEALGVYITDGNEAILGGDYRWGSRDANLPFANGFMRVTVKANGTLIQTAYSDEYKGASAQRYCKEGVWDAWEWVNPPMQLGVEYRTTERINGKAVYKKNVSGVIQYRLDGETEWKPYSNAIGPIVSNPNLLDNWYFADPINQRGLTEYAGINDYGFYTIDRWYLNNGSRVNYVQIIDGGIRVDSLTNGFLQFIETALANEIHGKTVTLSVKLVSGTVHSATFVYDSEKLSSVTIQAINTQVNFGKGSAGKPMVCLLTMATGNYLDIEAIKLELGSVQTLAHQDSNGNWVLNDPPPNRQQELAKCQRYFTALTAAGAQYGWGGIGFLESGTYYPLMNLPVPMRVIPSISYSGNWKIWTGSTGVDITNITVNTVSIPPKDCHYICLRVTPATNSTLVSNNIYTLSARSDTTAYIHLSADL